MLAFQGAVPPLVVHLVVVEHGDVLAEGLPDVARQEDLSEMVFFPKLGKLRLAEQLLELALLRLHGSDGIFLDLDRDVSQLGRGLDDCSK